MRPFVAAMVVDALGSGFYLPFAVLFFVSAHSIPIGVVGTAIAVANAAVIPLSAAIGAIIDRWRPLRILVWGNVIRCGVFVFYLFADRPVTAALALGATTVVDKFCWVAQASLIGGLSTGSGSRRLFSTVSWARNLGIGVGSAAGGVGASVWGVNGLYAVVLVNAATYAIAAVILARHVSPAVSRARPSAEQQTGHYRRILSDRPFLLLVSTKFCFVMCAIAVANFLPFYLVERVGLPAWMSGLVLTVNCCLIVLVQPWMTRRLTSVHRPLLLFAGGGSYVVGGALFFVTGWFSVAAAIAGVTIGMIIYTLGEIVIAPSSDSLAADLAPAAIMGRYQSAYQISWSVASVIVPGAGAFLLAAQHAWFWTSFILVAGAGAIMSLAIRERPAAVADSRRSARR